MTSDGITTRGYQQEMLEESLQRNIIIALDTGSGKTHIAVLRIKTEVERQPKKVSWFVAPTVALCEQQRDVIRVAISGPVGIISGSKEPDQWKNASLWQTALRNNRVMVSTPQVLLDALRHSYVSLGRDISLLIFDEAHHAVDNHPYNRIMKEFYFDLPAQLSSASSDYQRPSILGLTASPIYGGNVAKAFRTIEENLDSTIRTPRHHKDELAKFVYRPIFKHVLFDPPDIANPPFSTNLAALIAVVKSIDIQNDPYVHSLRKQLSRAIRGTAEYRRIDQMLSKVIQKEDSFAHKGLRDFERTAEAICQDLGSWAADWYVWEVVRHAKQAANPQNNIISTWKRQEKVYLLEIINRIGVSPVSYYPGDISHECSDKVHVLISTLLSEKLDTESMNESYSGLVFVQRRDTVLALAKLLQHHPATKDVFKFGYLLGTSDSSYRHSFLDITRFMLEVSPQDTLDNFKIGEITVIVSTAVAEEGIDIQACGSVIRWDPPQNMASWAQSRGRARRKKSTYTVLFRRGGSEQNNVSKWQNLEREMVELYNDPSRDFIMEEAAADSDVDDEVLEFRVPSTGYVPNSSIRRSYSRIGLLRALLTLHSAVSHLSHFCAVIPSSVHADNRPLYDVDPPEFAEGWHSFDNRSKSFVSPYAGPFGSKVTLPRSLPLPNREFATERIYRSRISAHRHAAFTAYKALYDAELLNDYLLPITSVTEPHLDEEVKEMLKDVERRVGFANVSLQLDPWTLEGTEGKCWHTYELSIDGLPPLILFNISRSIFLPNDEGPTLYRPGQVPISTYLRFIESISLSDARIEQARQYTKMLFWSLNGSRMSWEKDDFPYLVLPKESDTHWERRREWLSQVNTTIAATRADEYLTSAEKFGKAFAYPTDLAIVRNGFQFAKSYMFVGWRYDPLNEEEETAFRKYYSRFQDLEIVYPLLEVQPFPPRSNFLIPTPTLGKERPSERRNIFLLPRISAIAVLSHAESEYALLLPSILRSFACSITVSSLRHELFNSTPLYDIPNSLLLTAMTAPVSGERTNYQRLETLGDTVLKFVAGIQLLAEYPLWHEGYLTRKKDHAVANVRLAKENIKRSLYRWIIRDRMLCKKWKPNYIKPEISKVMVKAQVTDPIDEKIYGKKKKKQQELSTKVLADVVESLIGAAYLHGGFDLGYQCASFFDMGLRWQPLPMRIEALLARVEIPDDYPSQLGNVERILGYTFKRKSLLIEALTHASYEPNLNTPSYERMEFLGDSVLDMVVIDFLYHAPGKNYSPGHIYLRKSAVVNAHILAYICLSSSTTADATMPGINSDGTIALLPETHIIHLWQCLLHTSSPVLEDQRTTAVRYKHRKGDIHKALTSGNIFPWADLIRLQAPKFFSDMVESLIGAVFLDSSGDIDVVRSVITKLGILPILERIVCDDVDVLHPVSRLSLWASKHGKELQYLYEKEKGKVSCIILVDEKEECRVTETYHGRASQEEVKFMAAEQAIKQFRLRDVDVNYTLMKKKRGPTKKKQVFQASNSK
ncbi:hypothetical protein C0995_011318 [Termitomyces sp. Mi166|nr:hypothetical protein C0995_011318 [Termitomyces sp. Mi166\